MGLISNCVVEQIQMKLPAAPESNKAFVKIVLSPLVRVIGILKLEVD